MATTKVRCKFSVHVPPTKQEVSANPKAEGKIAKFSRVVGELENLTDSSGKPRTLLKTLTIFVGPDTREEKLAVGASKLFFGTGLQDTGSDLHRAMTIPSPETGLDDFSAWVECRKP